jgi:hypothetical protein
MMMIYNYKLFILHFEIINLFKFVISFFVCAFFNKIFFLIFPDNNILIDKLS